MNNNRNIMCWHGKEAELLSIRLPNVFEDPALLTNFKCFVFKTVSKNRVDRGAKFPHNPSTFTWTPYAHKSNVPGDDLLDKAGDKEVFITRDEQGSTNKPLQLLVETAGLGIQIVTHRHFKDPCKTDNTKHIETVICLWIP